MAEALYTIDILRLAASTAQWTALDHPEARAERRSPTCGSRVEVGVTVDDAGRVTAIGLSLSACALGQASAAILAQGALGRDAAELRAAGEVLSAWLSGMCESAPDWPGIDVLAAARRYPARHPSILLGFLAAADAVDGAMAARTVRVVDHG